jgi:hypothetical protein
VLKSEKNIYGKKQAGCVWNSFFLDKLMSIGFTPSLIDDCVSSMMTSSSWSSWTMVSSLATMTQSFKMPSAISKM